MTHVGLKTAQGTELLRISCVTAHIYLLSLQIKDFLSSGSLTSVNLMSMRSLSFRGFPDSGHKTVESGLSILTFSAAGVFDGTQKLGNFLSFPFAMFETEEVLASPSKSKFSLKFCIIKKYILNRYLF